MGDNERLCAMEPHLSLKRSLPQILWACDNEKLCAVEPCLQLKRSLPQVWLEPTH